MGEGNGACSCMSSDYLRMFDVFILGRQPFEQITGLTDVAEGTIVRVITRLDETCREVRDAARVIGDADLMKKMEEAQLKIKRDSEHLFEFRFRATLTAVLQLYSQQACISSCSMEL